MLCYLLQERLGCCCPLPHVSRFFKYAFKPREPAATIRADVDDPGTGIIFVYRSTELLDSPVWIGLEYFSISLSLNILLTLMIVMRLIMRARQTRMAMGMAGIGGLPRAIVTMLVESSTLFAVSSLLVLGPWSSASDVSEKKISHPL